MESYVRLPEKEPKADCIIIDGPALINALEPHRAKTFEEYAHLDLLPVEVMEPGAMLFPRANFQVAGKIFQRQ